MPNLNGTEEPQVYYRLKTNRHIDIKEFAKHIAGTAPGPTGHTFHNEKLRSYSHLYVKIYYLCWVLTIKHK